MSIDRAKLEAALVKVRDWSLNEDGAVMERFFGAEELARLCRAAEAHLATLPKTKMVEVWRVEWATKTNAGWVANHRGEPTKRDADEYALRLIGIDIACIRVTGPHQQEVPA